MGIHVGLTHVMRYSYDKPVTLSPHIIRLRPAPHSRTPILSYSLKIKPEKHFINWQQDPFGNYQARLVFPEPTTELSVEMDLIADLTVINPFDFFVEEYAENFPFKYDEDNTEELAPYLKTKKPGPLLKAWLKKNKPKKGAINDVLVSLNQAVQQDVNYRVRLEPGVQSAEETLELASGSCRDSAWLLVQILRNYGLAARFVSGYLVQLRPDEKPIEGPAGAVEDFTDLHAWAEVFLPGAGWVGLDATSGLLAGEGHIPLACTPLPTSAAPLSGMASGDAEDFSYSNTVQRIDERPRVTLPYTDKVWNTVLALGKEVDARLEEQDLRLTMGGEPTFVSSDDMEGAEWNHEALGKHKLSLAGDLMDRMHQSYAPQGLTSFAQGKWYPGEETPRWAMICHWRLDGKALWQNPERLALPGQAQAKQSHSSAEAFAGNLAGWLGVPDDCLMPAFEDPLHHLHLESLMPEGVDLRDLDLKDDKARRQLAIRLSQGLDEAVAWVLPLRSITRAGEWQSCQWPMRRGQVFLVPGDSPAGLRLPLDSVAIEADDAPLTLPEDTMHAEAPLPVPQQKKPKTRSKAHDKTFQTALCIEWREESIYVFLPPLRSAAEYVFLTHAIEQAAKAAGVAIILEGYEPPRDPRLQSFRITPDPGVIEVNVHPTRNFQELVDQTETLYQLAKESRLSAEKFMQDGRHTGTGGGNHITFGGVTPADSPFLRRPDLLGSMITWWQHHPSLSYLFSGMFIGPTSQAPRVDEARNESLYELELALSRLPSGESQQPWLVDRLLRNLLIDLTGNTHRAEICIDKLYSPDGPAGRQGLVEFRAFEMPPHARMSIIQALLLRCLISRFWDKPYSGKLVRWGTELHDRFMLPHYLWDDIGDVIDDVRAHGMPFERDWLDAFWEFRFPVYGTRQIGNISIELRAAIEPWHVLGEQASAGGMSRYVDSSLERLQVKVSGFTDSRYLLTCNNRVLPMRSTGVSGEYVVGVRYRAWQPPHCLHPDLPVDAPLVFDLIDTWADRSLGGCAYHVSHPGGRSYDDVPVNANVAEARRLARFEENRHTPATVTEVPEQLSSGSFVSTQPQTEKPLFTAVEENSEYPYTVDLRRQY